MAMAGRHRAARPLACSYSQKQMPGTPMIVVLCVLVLTPNMIRPPLLGRFGVVTRVSWKT